MAHQAGYMNPAKKPVADHTIVKVASDESAGKVAP
jgi:hypothetical protein